MISTRSSFGHLWTTFRCQTQRLSTKSPKETRLITRDNILRYHTPHWRLALVNASASLASAQHRWHWTSPMAIESWGNYMAGTVLYGSFNKGEERVKTMIQYPRKSGLDQACIEAMAAGEVRGYLQLSGHENHDQVESDGLMKVEKILYGQRSPYETTISATGDARLDWNTFYRTSEQIETFVDLTTRSGPKGSNRFCGGLVLQKLPSDEDDASAGNEYQTMLDLVKHISISAHLSELGTLGYLREVLTDAVALPENTTVTPLDFYCRCSKEKFSDRLQLFSSEEKEAMRKENPVVEATCAFCNETYQLHV